MRSLTMLNLIEEILSPLAGPPRRRHEPPKPKAQQVIYRGDRGRAKVTFVGGEAIVSKLKPSGAWKKVGVFPWVPVDDFRVNQALQEICGHEFYQYEEA